ncbi:MAG: D-aminoacyl-tRNA deacylase [Methanomassiliicoccus sp.]|nr:D-aminoacyl-tRNA deacylase [Methanomassiliicoccus sp.]
MRLLVCSTEDNASVNIRDALLSSGGWSEGGEMEGAPVHRRPGMAMITVPRLHLYCDNIDAAAAEAIGERPQEVVFLSRHKAASGQRSLTVHPIGNWGKADFGGRVGELVPAAPHLMTSLLRQLRREADGMGFEVTYEVTHHGPFLQTPTLFIEIGSSEESWGDPDAARAIARTLQNVEVSAYPVAMGIGGGHYAPRFTEASLGKRISFGHMLPNYAFDLKDIQALGERVRTGMERSGARLAYIHRKSMKRSEATVVAKLVADLGYDTVDSSDLEDIGPMSPD